MTAGKLLLKLTDKTLLNLVEGLEKLVGDVKDDGLSSGTAVNLLGGGDVEVLERGLELVGGHLQIEELLGDLGLELIGFLRDEEKLNKYCVDKVKGQQMVR